MFYFHYHYAYQKLSTVNLDVVHPYFSATYLDLKIYNLLQKYASSDAGIVSLKQT